MIPGNFRQTVFSEPLSQSRKEKAAHLVRFVVKDHPFAGGNKRIGTLVFLLHPHQEGPDHRLNTQALTARALLIAKNAPV